MRSQKDGFIRSAAALIIAPEDLGNGMGRELALLGQEAEEELGQLDEGDAGAAAGVFKKPFAEV